MSTRNSKNPQSLIHFLREMMDDFNFRVGLVTRQKLFESRWGKRTVELLPPY